MKVNWPRNRADGYSRVTRDAEQLPIDCASSMFRSDGLSHGYPHSFRIVGGYGDADLLRFGRSQPNVHPGLRGVLRPRFRLRVLARSVAVRIA